MFEERDILYEDNHIMVVNKHCGDLVQSDPDGTTALEDQIKAFIKVMDNKPGDVFLGVVHRIDRPVSGAVLFAKTSKALVRLNEMVKMRQIKKLYWALTDNMPEQSDGVLKHYIVRDGKTNRSYCYDKERKDGKPAEMRYRVIGKSDKYNLIEVELITGRHHQIRCQLSAIGCPIKGDLKYGARRSNPNGGISLHSRSIEFIHPVKKELMKISAPVPTDDNLWNYFEHTVQIE